MSRGPIAAALALLASLSLASCARDAEPARPRNVIFILVDTLRADHLGIYGYARDTSPNVDAFARESVVRAERSAATSGPADGVSANVGPPGAAVRLAWRRPAITAP